MDFKEALQKSLKKDKRTHKDIFLLHSHLCDFVGNDYESKKAAEEFYRLDAKYEISKTILGSAPVRYKKRKKHTYRLKSIAPPPHNALVFYTVGSLTLHLSGECPCLKGESILRSTYLEAKRRNLYGELQQVAQRDTCENTQLDLRANPPKSGNSADNGGSDALNRLNKCLDPHICRRCGGFRPTFKRPFAEKLMALINAAL